MQFTPFASAPPGGGGRVVVGWNQPAFRGSSACPRQRLCYTPRRVVVFGTTYPLHGCNKRRTADMEEYDRLKEMVEAAADDVAKATGGNKAAGTRVRKAMQEIKDTAQQVRKKILEVRSQTPTP
jgi:hypothetical protein